MARNTIIGALMAGALVAGIGLTAAPAIAAESRGGNIACGTTRTHGTTLRASGNKSIRHEWTGGLPYYKWSHDTGIIAETVYKNWGVKNGRWDVNAPNASGIISLTNTCYT